MSEIKHENKLAFSRQDATALITLNRPEVYNALDLEMATRLRDVLVTVERDSQLRAAIISGSGKAFCSGGDLRFAVKANPEQPGKSFLALTEILHDCVLRLRTMSTPVIAAINGPAAGAGFFLAMACDLRIIADAAYLKQSNTTYGLTLPAGGTFHLPRLIGIARTLELVLLDEKIPAQQALEWGLVHRVAPSARLLRAAKTLAQQVAQKPLGVLGRVKRLINESFHSPLDTQLEKERRAIAQSADTAEGREGLAAFLEKRKPAYFRTPILRRRRQRDADVELGKEVQT